MRFRLPLLTFLALASHPGTAQQAPVVVVDTVERAMLAPTIDVPGTVVSRFDARLASELAARLEWIAEVGTRVAAGEPVARLDNVTFRISRAEAESRVQREQARVMFLESERHRLEQLARNNLSAKSQLDQVASELAVAESDVAIAEAQLDHARVQLAMTEIKAPFDGIVTERLRNLGERLNVADEVIRLVSPDSLEIVARAPLHTVNYIAVGDVLDLHNDFRNGTSPVRTIVPFGDPQSHMFEVRLDADPGLWTVGESVRLSMPTAEAKEVTAVSRDALVLRREGASVFRVRQDGTVEKISVITGMGAGERIEIIGSVEPGDRVVVRGAERLSDNTPVTVSGDTAASRAGSAAND